MTRPKTIDGEPVYGHDGEYVLGAELEPQDDEAEITLHAGEHAAAAQWLAERGWDKQEGYKTASEMIVAALRTGSLRPPERAVRVEVGRRRIGSE